MLQAEKIQSNWDRYINEIKTNISKERTDVLIPFLEKYNLTKERIRQLKEKTIKKLQVNYLDTTK